MHDFTDLFPFCSAQYVHECVYYSLNVWKTCMELIKKRAGETGGRSGHDIIHGHFGQYKWLLPHPGTPLARSANLIRPSNSQFKSLTTHRPMFLSCMEIWDSKIGKCSVSMGRAVVCESRYWCTSCHFKRVVDLIRRYLLSFCLGLVQTIKKVPKSNKFVYSLIRQEIYSFVADFVSACTRPCQCLGCMTALVPKKCPISKI